MQEVRLAFRRLLRRPWATVAAVLALACSVGAVAATWSLLSAVVFSPLAVPNADRLLVVGRARPSVALSVIVILKPARAVARVDLTRLMRDELRSFMRERLAHFKTPKTVTFLAELPKTATGKIQKFVLRGNKPGIGLQ